MTVRALNNEARRVLSAVTPDAAFEAACLAEHFFGLAHAALLTHGDRVPTAEAARGFQNAVRERVSGRPLQYILGAWEFMGLSLFCGEGVLIPREDTAVLVEAACARIERGAQGLDLCGGTGAVALALADRAGASVTSVEKFPEALAYLRKNCARYPALSVRPIAGDVLDAAFADSMPCALDFIVSNPPYIEAAELPHLQLEVQKEPETALDGGADGLVFYRAICAHWARHLRPGGVLAVEIGETQGEAVAALFAAVGLTEIAVFNDTAGLPRAVRGIAAR